MILWTYKIWREGTQDKQFNLLLVWLRAVVWGAHSLSHFLSGLCKTQCNYTHFSTKCYKRSLKLQKVCTSTYNVGRLIRRYQKKSSKPLCFHRGLHKWSIFCHTSNSWLYNNNTPHDLTSAVMLIWGRVKKKACPREPVLVQLYTEPWQV